MPKVKAFPTVEFIGAEGNESESSYKEYTTSLVALILLL